MRTLQLHSSKSSPNKAANRNIELVRFTLSGIVSKKEGAQAISYQIQSNEQGVYCLHPSNVTASSE